MLKDPNKRQEYDQLRANWKQYQHTGSGNSSGGFDISQFGRAPGGGSFYYEGDIGDMFGAGGNGFSDFFNVFFEDMSGSQMSEGFNGFNTKSASQRGNDLIYKVDIDLYTAILGGKIDVNTVLGKLSLNVPKGSQPGSKLFLTGEGIPVFNKPGNSVDLYIQLNVNIPRYLSDEELDLFRKLMSLRNKHAYTRN